MKNSLAALACVSVFCLSLLLSQKESPRMDTLSIMSAPTPEIQDSGLPLNFCPETPMFSASLSAWQDEESILPMPPPPPEVVNVPKVVPVLPKSRGYKVITAKVTAYCPCARCCGVMRGITSTQSSAWTKGVAVDPRAIPYGTLVEVEGYGKFKADDTGGAMRRMYRRYGIIQIDVRMKYHYSAQQWGVRWMKVKVYE